MRVGKQSTSTIGLPKLAGTFDTGLCVWPELVTRERCRIGQAAFPCLAKLADAAHSKCAALGHPGSSPGTGTRLVVQGVIGLRGAEVPLPQ